jgi:hypothetical protein
MTLDERICVLERRCRRLTGGLVLLLVLAGVGVFMGASRTETKDETLRTQRLEIVDSDGKVRLCLGAAEEGFGLMIYDAEGHVQAALTDTPRGAAMRVAKDGGEIRLTAAGAQSLSVRDVGGKPRAVLFVTKYGEPQFQLLDEQGTRLFTAPSQPVSRAVSARP